MQSLIINFSKRPKQMNVNNDDSKINYHIANLLAT